MLGCLRLYIGSCRSCFLLFAGLDQRGLRSCVGDEMVEGTSLEEAFGALTAAQGTLIDIVTQRFNEALSRSDQVGRTVSVAY